MSDGAAPIVSGRSCDGCTMCCKLLGIGALDKPAGVNCVNCDPGRGCRIYDARPAECASFFCSWMLTPALGEEWRPSKSRMVISYEAQSRGMQVHVDPSRSDAWKREPYYRQLKKMALNSLQNGGYLLIWQGPEAIAVLPDRDMALGRIRVDSVIAVREMPSASGPRYDVKAFAPDDPALAAMGYRT